MFRGYSYEVMRLGLELELWDIMVRVTGLELGSHGVRVSAMELG